MAEPKIWEMNKDQWPKNFDYRVLPRPRNMIRLLLHETRHNTRLHYSSCPTELGNPPDEYHALSYCWGTPVPESALKKIFIDGKEVYIKPTLRTFLKTMERLHPGMRLWIDAICINQDDVNERNNQISIMGKIYEETQEVIVWLGKGDDDTNYATDQIKDFSPQACSKSDQETFSIYLDKLIRVPYWTRRWVLQEFALAKNLTIVRGSREIKWVDLLTGPRKSSTRILGANGLTLSFEKYSKSPKDYKMLLSEDNCKIPVSKEQSAWQS